MCAIQTSRDPGRHQSMAILFVLKRWRADDCGGSQFAALGLCNVGSKKDRPHAIRAKNKAGPIRVPWYSRALLPFDFNPARLGPWLPRGQVNIPRQLEPRYIYLIQVYNYCRCLVKKVRGAWKELNLLQFHYGKAFLPLFFLIREAH